MRGDVFMRLIVKKGDQPVGQFNFGKGPVYIGSDTIIEHHSSILENTSIEYNCTISGHIQSTSIEPHSHIQRGNLSHSWLGRWVNLGTGTTTSYKKSTYGTIRVVCQGQRIETGMHFLGSIFGSYVTTGVNATLFTAKTVGV